MLVTRQADYALRIIRALSKNDTLSVKVIAERESVPFQFAYKIITKLDKASIVVSFRGANGGYALNCDLKKLTLYDILTIIDDDMRVNDCTGSEFYFCPNNLVDKPCMLHKELSRVQRNLINDLKKNTLYDIFCAEEKNC